jgi:hypothetical protein
MNELLLDPDLISTLRTLETHRVEFVLIGDAAHAVYNHGGLVSGVAIVPGNYGRNVERLMGALDAMNAEIGIAGRADPRGLDWRRMDLRELAPCTFMTMHADIDIDFEPAGTNGYRDLFQDAYRVEVGTGAQPHVVSIEDLDRMEHGAPPQAAAPHAQYAPEPSPTGMQDAPGAAPPPATAPATPPSADEYDLGIWTEEEFRAIRAGRIPS